MSDVALLILGGVAACAGMICLALSLPAHWRQLLGTRPQTGTMRAILRAAGAVALLATLACCLRADSAAMAVLLFTMLLTASALCTALGLAIQGNGASPRSVRRNGSSSKPGL